MKLEDQVVSLELAKKLKELGVKQESAFIWMNTGKNYECVLEPDLDRWYDGQRRETWQVDCAAFTVAELGEMLPDTVIPRAGQLYGGQYRYLNIDKSSGDCWFVAYLPLEFNSQDEVENQMLCAEENEADARAKMLVYLL